MQRIAVFCGSSHGTSRAYSNMADQLAQVLVHHRLELVYGGASVGLMGTLANAVLKYGGKVVGVLPEVLSGKEIAFQNAHELHIVENMHSRKALMYELADGFMVLPGGLGTLDELFEIWTWSQLGLHQKPIGLLQVDQYFDGLIDFLRHATRAGFVKPDFAETLLISDDPDDLLMKFQSYVPPPVPAWIRLKDR